MVMNNSSRYTYTTLINVVLLGVVLLRHITLLAIKVRYQ